MHMIPALNSYHDRSDDHHRDCKICAEHVRRVEAAVKLNEARDPADYPVEVD